MGLAFDEISVEGVPTPFGRMVKSGELDRPVRLFIFLSVLFNLRRVILFRVIFNFRA